jgi:MYXO-CTERM domain-containing protein
MRNHQTLSPWVAVVLFGLATFSARAAQADDSTCQTDTDCGKGWSCQVTGGTACGAPACPPGAICDPAPACTNTVIKSCVPANCSTDADCADGMACHAEPVACPAIACPSNADCAQPVCDPGPRQCTPKYELPCAADADCGAGFTCAYGEVCSGGSASGSGSSGTPPSPGGAGSGDVPAPSTCTTSTAGNCQLTPVACLNNADCQMGWSCMDVAPGYGCAEVSAMGSGGTNSAGASAPAPGSAGVAGTAGSAGSAGSVSIDCPPPPAPMMQCVPPSYSSGYGTNKGSSATTGSAGAASRGGSGLSTPAAPGATSGPSSAGSGDAATSTSCAVAVPGAAGNRVFALLALGLLGFARRRRVVIARGEGNRP